MEDIEAHETDTAFGLELHRELRRLGVPTFLDYATLQRLKESNRDEVVHRMRGKVPYAMLRALREDDPREIAQRIHLAYLWGGAMAAAVLF